jgi:prephenate dehydrogenase
MAQQQGITMTVVGLGLIGGSFSLALQEAGAVSHVIGVDAQPEHAALALSLGIAHEIAPLAEACARSQAVVVAVPVDRCLAVLEAALGAVPAGALVMDMGSTKHLLCQQLAAHPKRGQYVAAHPMAGTEYSGPAAAFPGLFQGKKVVVCEKGLSHDEALTQALSLFQAIGMKVSFMDAKSHDRHAAYISHLSHITSFTLGLAVLEVEKDESRILDMAGSGFASTVRLAKSSPAMWRPIFLQNKTNMLEALDQYAQQLQRFRQALETADGEALDRLMREANAIGRIL